MRSKRRFRNTDAISQTLQTAHVFNPNTQRITRSIATQIKVAARDAVFNTHELVENIISFLPAKNIFGVMRVSKSQFKAVIDSSPDLRTKMFIRSGCETIAKPFSSAGASQDVDQDQSEASGASDASDVSEPRATKMEDLLPVIVNPVLGSSPSSQVCQNIVCRVLPIP